MTEPVKSFGAQDAQDLMTQIHTLLKPITAGEGAAVFVDQEHMSQVRAAFFAARDSRRSVTERHGSPVFEDSFTATRAEWQVIGRALGAMGSLLQVLGQQIPGGIPELNLGVVPDGVNPYAVENLRHVLERTQPQRKDVYDRTIGSYTEHTITDKDLFAFEDVIHAANLVVGRDFKNA